LSGKGRAFFVKFDTINAKRDWNILKVLLARIDEGRRYLALNLPPSIL
jgi:hypothetical protein